MLQTIAFVHKSTAMFCLCSGASKGLYTAALGCIAHIHVFHSIASTKALLILLLFCELFSIPSRLCCFKYIYYNSGISLLQYDVGIL